MSLTGQRSRRPAGAGGSGPAEAGGGGAVELSFAIADYDHVRALLSGDVVVDGIRFGHVALPSWQIFERAWAAEEFDLFEGSLAMAVAMVATGDTRYAFLPVYPSRRFRHSAVYVAASSPMRKLEQLAGLRVGLPKWSQTACIYVRGLIAEHHGVPLESISWVEGPVDDARRNEHVELRLPGQIRITSSKGRSLSSMLLEGELDAIVAAGAPKGLRSGELRTLLDSPGEEESAYYDATGVFPIMHVIGMRSALHDADPGLAERLVAGFEQAKRWSLERICSANASLYPLPQLPDLVAGLRRRFGDDPFPYGLEGGRPSLEAFCRYCHEQGITDREVRPEELFRALVRVPGGSGHPAPGRRSAGA